MLLGLAACTSHTQLPETLRRAIDERHRGGVVELKHSSFYGPLYDDTGLWLLSPYDFSMVSDLVDTTGQPIFPPKQLGIVPAGTRFVIERIEFPDTAAMWKRMVTTPRYNPWVYLRLQPQNPESEQPSALPLSRAYVIVLPRELTTQEGVDAAIATHLAPEGNIRRWLVTLRPSAQVAIAHKAAEVGMLEAELFAAQGPPLKWFADSLDGKAAKVAWYGLQEFWLVDGVVTKMESARAVAKEPAGAAPR